MNEEANLTPAPESSASIPETEEEISVLEMETAGAQRRRLPAQIRRILAPFDGMHHVWLAFLFPVVIMALIYIAMEVWPFGKNSVLVLDLNGQYVYYFEAMSDIISPVPSPFWWHSSRRA